MLGDFFSRMDRPSFLLGWAMIAAPIIAAFTLIHVSRDEPIDYSNLLGCYVAKDAPPLLVEPGSILIQDGSGRTFSFVTDISNSLGHQLNVRPALRLERERNGSLVFKRARGIGYIWPLLAKGSDEADRLRSIDEFDGRFMMHSREGLKVIYERVDKAHLSC